MLSSIATSQGQIAILDSKPDADPGAKTIVLIHGHCTNKEFFSAQFNSPLLSDYRLIALDLPGYGASEPPRDPLKGYSFSGYAAVLAEVVHHFALTNYFLLGWSLGGHVALEVCEELDNLKGLIITGTPPIEISPEGFAAGFITLNPAVANCFGKGNLTREEAKLLAAISGYDGSPEKEFLVEAILQTDEGAKTLYPASIAKGVGKNELEIIKKFPQPIAVIGGAEDSAINYDYVKKLAFNNLWQNQVHLVPGAGHGVFMEKPDAFNALVREFLEH